jgi:dTMP kinase
MKKGKFITIEGPDFAGKSTLIKKLKAILSALYYTETFVYTREPGNLLVTQNAEDCEAIRARLLSIKCKDALEEAELFAESRYLHTQDIVDTINKGVNVISDRYLLSSVVYQGQELGAERVCEINKASLELLRDNNIEYNNITLDLNYANYKARASLRELDAMEQKSDEYIRQMLYNYSIGSVETFYHINKYTNAFNYHIDANRNSENVAMDALSVIYKLI